MKHLVHWYETLDIGIDLGAPVSLDYFDRKPFAFDGRIERVTVELKHGAVLLQDRDQHEIARRAESRM